MQVSAAQRILTLGGVLFFSLVCFTASRADTYRFEAVQLARFAVDTKRFVHRNYYEIKRRQVTLKYDEHYRPPFSPAGPAVFDCSTVKRLGVAFQLKRSNRLSTESVNWDVVWSYEADGKRELIDEHSHQALFWSKSTEQFLVETLPIFTLPEWQKNGVFHVEIRVWGRVLVENAIQLEGC